MSRDLGRLGVESAQLPLAALLLQDKRHGIGALSGRHIERDDAVIARRQIGNHEDRAVPRLSVRAKHSAQELGTLQWRSALGLEQKWRTRRRLALQTGWPGFP